MAWIPSKMESVYHFRYCILDYIGDIWMVLRFQFWIKSWHRSYLQSTMVRATVDR